MASPHRIHESHLEVMLESGVVFKMMEARESYKRSTEQAGEQDEIVCIHQLTFGQEISAKIGGSWFGAYIQTLPMFCSSRTSDLDTCIRGENREVVLFS